MGIVNRSLDSSEQNVLVNYNSRPTVTSTSYLLSHMPFPGSIQSAKLSAVGVSGSPTAQLQIKRFVTGAGETFIPLGAALALVATSTSGPQSYTFSATALQSGDALVVTNGGANSAVDQLNVAIVVQATQDIKSWDF